MSNSDQDPTAVEIERLRKELDAETQRCIELQRQLDRTNTEFEEFVSTAAHNLREPLRDVAAFGQLLTETHAGRLDSDALVLLGRIQEGAAKMQSLLADVVDFWATGASGREPVRTDMEAVLERALLTLENQIAEHCANVTHDPLPSVMGDFGILVKVLQHLIRNAVEYCVTSSPQVHISASREQGDWVFAVRDNGPGIDPMFQERIFGTFKRLHGREYPGNGLGLAFSRKAVEVDGGRMWVESTTGAGSTFYFTLPPAD